MTESKNISDLETDSQKASWFSTDQGAWVQKYNFQNPRTPASQVVHVFDTMILIYSAFRRAKLLNTEWLNLKSTQTLYTKLPDLLYSNITCNKVDG